MGMNEHNIAPFSPQVGIPNYRVDDVHAYFMRMLSVLGVVEGLDLLAALRCHRDADKKAKLEGFLLVN